MRATKTSWLVRVLAVAMIGGSLTAGMASTAAAQTIRGTITGTVTDTTGAVLPAITVTVTQVETGIQTSAQTTTQGRYTIPLLASGTYQAAVEQQGFKKHVRTGIVVQIAQTTRLDITLEVGEMNETVEVLAQTAQVRSTTAELGQVIEMKQIQGLPLNGRFFQHLISLTPGAMPFYGRGDSAENSSAAGARIATAHTVNGMPWSGNEYLLDGVINNEPQNAYINITPPLEAIQEFKVQSSNPTAEFGVFGGAAVNLSIRSGTNDLHGSLFEYLRDDALNTRSFFAPSKAPYQSNQFGFTLGGPLRKNRAFFFGDYQGLRLDQGRTQTLSVPTALMRQGNFTEIADQIYDPLTGQPFAGNIIPSAAINPISRKVADIWPLPNRPGVADNYVENNVVTQDVNAGDLRFDYTLRDNASLFFRGSAQKRHYDEPAPGNIFMGANNSDSKNYNAVVGYTHTFASNKFYELRAGYNYYKTDQYAEDFGIEKNNELGIINGNLPGHPETTGIASFRPTGFSNTGSPGTTNALRVGRTYHLTNNLTWVRGGHTMKSGVDLRFVNGAVTNPQTQPQGRFVFDRNYTSRAGASGTGYSFASFLLGYPTQIQRDIVDTYPETDRVLAGLFVQDDIRIGQKLSLQLGVRWDIMTPPIQPDNRQSNFNPTDGLIHLATDDNRGPDRKTHWDYVAPRIGVAYTPDKGKTALRAAFGISYFADNFGANGGTNERNYPFFQEVNLVSPTQFVPFRSVSDGLPTFATVALAETLRPPTGFAVFYIPADFHEDTVKMWNVGVQRQLGWGAMADVNYVGTRGTNLFRSYNINVPAPGPGTVNPRRPYYAVAPNITTITLRQGDGESWYDALQTKIDKRFSHGIQGLISYTFSRTEDNVAPAGLHPLLEGRRMRANSKALDIPHLFVVSATYELPFGEGRRFLSGEGVARHVLGGWSLSAITNYHSGDPLNIQVAASRLNTGTGNWADVTCDAIGTPHEVTAWFDTSCFADPAQYEFGNYEIGDVRGPSVFNTDLSLFKRTSIGRGALELRVDIFNVFNRAHFSNPNTTFGNAAFGRISATRLPPREAQVGVRYLF